MGEPRARSRFGEYGGRYAPESLVEACREEGGSSCRVRGLSCR
ncbi:tryptophan synthase beta subunit [Thermocatellispora tengchongensis]|uniref:Tryptophan synthase beta subunit n=1 Tax=Thermocatellispora tengchongensis TaxID=1073253 RepID=A0A840PL27_9ACTN|nr:tryptophan synthase beta subunit [Thermocatellispora tengchongensis]